MVETLNKKVPFFLRIIKRKIYCLTWLIGEGFVNPKNSLVEPGDLWAPICFNTDVLWRVNLFTTFGGSRYYRIWCPKAPLY